MEIGYKMSDVLQQWCTHASGRDIAFFDGLHLTSKTSIRDLAAFEMIEDMGQHMQ